MGTLAVLIVLYVVLLSQKTRFYGVNARCDEAIFLTIGKSIHKRDYLWDETLEQYLHLETNEAKNDNFLQDCCLIIVGIKLYFNFWHLFTSD